MMNLLDRIIYFYGKLHEYKGVPYWLLTPLRRGVRIVANCILPKYIANLPINNKSGGEIVVSLTSFPARINNVWQVVKCLLNQTYKPKQIILWLSKEQFPNITTIPISLRKLEGEVFKIRMVDGDIRSHKKYYYVSKEYPDDYVLLVDDDIYYPSDLLEKTWLSHLENPNAVICNYGYHISYNSDGTFMNYDKWKQEYHSSNADDLFFGSGGGTLFRPCDMYKDLLNINLALKLTPTADDIWLNTMVRLSNQRIVLLDNRYLLPVKNKSNITLYSHNVGMSQNDVQLSNIFRYYNI